MKSFKVGSMNLLFLLMPCFLMLHNTVNFTQLGAPENYATILNCVVTEYVETIEDHNDLRLVNKTAILDKKIHKIGLHFESTKTFPAPVARTMMVGLVDSFVAALNKSERLIPFRPDPCRGPFTAANVEIRVTFVDPCKYSYPIFGDIKYMIYNEGVITYYTGNPRCLGYLTRYREEPLDFARKASPAQYIPPKCRPIDLQKIVRKPTPAMPIRPFSPADAFQIDCP